MKKTLKIKQGGTIMGSYVIKTWDAEKYPTFESTKGGVPLSVSAPVKNKVVAGTGYGKNLIIRRLAGDTTYGLEIDSAAIGTGTTAPADSDTALQTPVLSGIAVADSEVFTSSLALSFFITDAQLANSTYTEFGIFCNLRLFARSLILPTFAKASGVNITVEYTITLT